MDKIVLFLGFLGLAFAVIAFVTTEWLWLVPSVIIMLYNQRRLFSKKK